MRISIRGKVLLVGACMLAGASAWAQQSQKPAAPAKVSTDLAVTFATERSQVVPGQSSFWFKGDYLWEAYIDGELVGSSKFHIEEVGLVTFENNPYFELISLKVYPGPFAVIDESDSGYGQSRGREDETVFV